MNTLNVLVIDGTARKDGETRKLAKLVERELARRGAATTFFSHESSPLPIFDGDETKLTLPELRRLFEAVRAADIVILSSPEYHNSMSGVLKNLLDWLSEMDGRLKGRLVGLVGGGASQANSGAMVQMMMAARSMHAWVMPEVLLGIPNIWEAFGPDGELLDEALRQRVASFADKMLQYGGHFRALRQQLPAAA